jgi:hypothetical protein
MTCSEFERQILLDEAAELSPALRATLTEHLAGCTRCRAFRQEFQTLAGTLRAETADTPAAPETVRRRILAEAAAAAPVRRISFVRPWQAALAAAAGLALLLGYWHLTAPRTVQPGTPGAAAPTAARISEVSSLLAALVGPEEDHLLQSEAAHTHSDIKSVARQLLILQDMTLDVPEDLAENATPPAESLPTTLRWHSTPAVPAERCG